MRKIPELLSPAGNYEKMKAAILYGADAVYLSAQIFGMRSAADNFTVPEIYDAVAYAHARGVRVYLTVNTMPREYEYPMLEDFLSSLRGSGIDALIIADIGVMSLARRILPDTEIHISTQANSVSSADCIAWHELGAGRIVLARELSLDEIKQIRDKIPPEIELEAFIHGSMCISYSGRCLLSGFLTGRDANRGACTQPCRWNYTAKERIFEITEEKRPDIPIPLIEERGETFVMSSRDMCIIEHIPEIVSAGIDSFKIEGRMKSAYYAAVVTNTYRMALDSYASGDYRYNPKWLSELLSVSHREYDTGYYFSSSATDPKTCKNTGYLKEKSYLATVVEYDSTSGEALCIQKNKMSVGEKAELLTPGRTGEPFIIEKLYDENHNETVSTPHPQMKFYIKVPFPVKYGDIIRASDND